MLQSGQFAQMNLEKQISQGLQAPAVTNDMNPFQGLKRCPQIYIVDVASVTNDMNPFQGLKLCRWAIIFIFLTSQTT